MLSSLLSGDDRARIGCGRAVVVARGAAREACVRTSAAFDRLPPTPESPDHVAGTNRAGFTAERGVGL
jgi:hypothetical protein